MTRRTLSLRTRRSLLSLVSAIAFGTLFTGEAQATCFTTSSGQRLVSKAQFAAAGAAAGGIEDDQSGGDALVGLWNAEYLLGSGPDLFDQAFQQFHSDGTEMMLSRGLPPSLGNVCLGIWKQNAPRTFTLKHMAWNWDSSGHFISIFVMEVTLRLDRRGNRYTGTWSSDNLNPTSGQPIPGEHFDGIVRGTRITIE